LKQVPNIVIGEIGEIGEIVKQEKTLVTVSFGYINWQYPPFNGKRIFVR
jgi:hypothetical protein